MEQNLLSLNNRPDQSRHASPKICSHTELFFLGVHGAKTFVSLFSEQQEIHNAGDDASWKCIIHQRKNAYRIACAKNNIDRNLTRNHSSTSSTDRARRQRYCRLEFFPFLSLFLLFNKQGLDVRKKSSWVWDERESDWNILFLLLSLPMRKKDKCILYALSLSLSLVYKLELFSSLGALVPRPQQNNFSFLQVSWETCP